MTKTTDPTPAEPLGEKSLAPSFQTREREAIDSQLREAYGRLAYTHKTHEKMAEQFNTTLWWLKTLQIILSACTAVGAVSVFFDKNAKEAAVATALFSGIQLIVNGLTKNTDHGQQAQKHRQVAASLWEIRDAYLSLIADIVDPAMSLNEIRSRRDKLQDRLGKIYNQAPHTNAMAYKAAQIALQLNEELTFNEGEVDSMLPAKLRHTKQ